MLSTGSPLAPNSYDYIYQNVKSDLSLCSIAGGTDIIGCFFAGTADFPIYREKLPPPSLGFSLKAMKPDGSLAAVGEPGDLVCDVPFPSMPRKFLNDAGGNRYAKAYFDANPGVWTHGDFIVFDSLKFSVMRGRSDATLNPNGVRFGTSDLYNVLDKICWVRDALAVPQRHPVSLEERVVLFVISDEELNVGEVKKAIRTELTVRHVPSVILPIEDIPYTISGKKVEVAVRDIINGKPVAYREAFRNPESLDLYQQVVDNGLLKWV